MVRYRFELATRDDDAALRKVLRATPMDGKISITFQREPSYFEASVVDGRFRQVVVCRDSQSDEIVGFGSRSIREMYVNGRPVPIGYLSSLRVLQPYRNLGLIARGYRYFRDLHADGRTELYLTTIAEGNQRALTVLTSARAGLPGYHFAGRQHTVAIPIPRRPSRKQFAGGSLQIRAATPDDLPTVVAFLQREGPRRQFFPKYTQSDFLGPNTTFKGLVPADLLLAFQQRQIVGTLAGWDQRAYRQTVVNKYEPPLSWARPLYNGWAMLCHRPRLPDPGKSFRYLSAAVPIVTDDRVDVFSALLDVQLARLAGGDADYFLVGLHESDPLLPIAIRRRSVSYTTRLYYACWDGEDSLRFQLDARPIYLELGTL